MIMTTITSSTSENAVLGRPLRRNCGTPPARTLRECGHAAATAPALPATQQ